MLNSVFALIKNDVRRQTDWARSEIARQSRETSVTLALAAVGGSCVVALYGVGLVALYVWLEPNYGSLNALGVVAAVLLTTAGLLLAIAFGRAQEPATPQPVVRLLEPEALKEAVVTDFSAGSQQAVSAIKDSPLGPAIAAGENAYKSGAALYGELNRHLKGRSTPVVITTLGVVALMGLVLGRRR
jgi:hypothetical protein